MIDKDMVESLHRGLDAAINKANKDEQDHLVLTEMVGWIHEVLANKRTIDTIRWRMEHGL